jgi:leucine-rich repeat-containing G protein-coupled receptor 8
VASLFYRLLLVPARRNRGIFIVFVTHLAVADLLMGVYLGVADLVYKGSYPWNEVRWRGSVMCTVAGVLSFVSCEVSAQIIVLITLDRFLVMKFPFSQLRFSHR